MPDVFHKKQEFFTTQDEAEGDYRDGTSYTSSVGFAATYTSSDAFRATFPSRGRLRYSFLLTVAIAMLEFFTVTITKMFCLFLRGKNLRGLPLEGKVACLQDG